MCRIIPAAQNGNAAVTLLSQVRAMFMSLSSIKSGTVSAKARKAVTEVLWKCQSIGSV